MYGLLTQLQHCCYKNSIQQNIIKHSKYAIEKELNPFFPFVKRFTCYFPKTTPKQREETVANI